MTNTNIPLRFLRGTHSNLNNLPESQIQNGAFYLTTDTNRLYIGQESKLIELNKSVTVVDLIEQNPEYAEKTYLPTENIEDGQFYYVKESNVLCVYSGSEKKWKQINPDTFTTGFNTLVAKDSNGLAVITNTLQQNNSKANLTSDISFAPGNNINIDVDSKGKKITISATDTNTTNSSLAITPYLGSTATSASDNDKKTGYSIKVVDSSSNEVEDTIDPVVTYGTGSVKSEAKFRNNTLHLDVYSSKEIDELFRTADAMTFKGAINKIDDIPNQKIKNGDTYKVASVIKNDDDTILYNIGDLLIASGKENEDGYISGSVNWIHVPVDTTHNKIKTTELKTEEITSGGTKLIVDISTQDEEEYNKFETTITSDTLAITSERKGTGTNITNNINFELMWGSFDE